MVRTPEPLWKEKPHRLQRRRRAWRRHFARTHRDRPAEPGRRQNFPALNGGRRRFGATRLGTDTPPPFNAPEPRRQRLPCGRKRQKPIHVASRGRLNWKGQRPGSACRPLAGAPVVSPRRGSANLSLATVSSNPLPNGKGASARNNAAGLSAIRWLGSRRRPRNGALAEPGQRSARAILCGGERGGPPRSGTCLSAASWSSPSNHAQAVPICWLSSSARIDFGPSLRPHDATKP